MCVCVWYAHVCVHLYLCVSMWVCMGRCVFVCMCVHMCGGAHLHLIISIITTISILSTRHNLGFLPFRNQESPFSHKFILNHFLWKHPSLLCNIFMCGLLFQIPPSEITSHITLPPDETFYISLCPKQAELFLLHHHCKNHCADLLFLLGTVKENWIPSWR